MGGEGEEGGDGGGQQTQKPAEVHIQQQGKVHAVHEYLIRIYLKCEVQPISRHVVQKLFPSALNRLFCITKSQ